MKQNSEIIISVDIEADGPIPGEYSMLSLGACVIDQPESETFYVEFCPLNGNFVPDALAVSGLDRDQLWKTGSIPQVAMRDFTQWVLEVSGKSKPVFASFSTWDWIFVYYYLIRFTGKSPFGHSSLDMKSYYMGKYASLWTTTAKKNMAKDKPGFFKNLGPHTHNALDDAQEQAELFSRIIRDFKYDME